MFFEKLLQAKTSFIEMASTSGISTIIWVILIIKTRITTDKTSDTEANYLN